MGSTVPETLNAIDLNAGVIRWKIPFGEFTALAAKGITNTGSDNYGGPVVTAGALVFIVIVCGGGKNGAPSGSSIVAFALPPR